MDISKHTEFFAHFAAQIEAYEPGGEQILTRLTLAQDDNLRVVYAPFDHIAPKADLVIVGITPGRTQAINSIIAAASAMRAGQDSTEALRLAKRVGSFSGSMRSNLVSMLDAIGLQSALDIVTCSTLFQDSARVHFTSALRYPVFIDEENYNGSPDMLTTPLLKGMIDTCLADEARQLRNAFWLPLGKQPARALGYLCDRGLLDRAKVLEGLPHPSGANAERIAYFTGRKAKENLSPMTNPHSLDAARETLKRKVESLHI